MDQQEKQIEAYMKWKHSEKTELERLKAVTDIVTAEKIEAVRNQMREEEIAVRVAQEKVKETKRSGEEEKSLAVSKEYDELEAKFFENKLKEPSKIQEILEKLPENEQEKIWKELSKTEELKDKYETSEYGESVSERLNRIAKDNLKDRWKANDHENPWDQLIFAIVGSVFDKLIEASTEKLAEKSLEEKKNMKEQKAEDFDFGKGIF